MPTKTAPYQSKGERRKMLISADDYQRMGEAGIFKDKPRVELIDGEIFEMSPIGNQHNSHVDKANQFFTINLMGKANIRTQGSIRLDAYSEPEPDICILRLDEHFYHGQQATANDVFLLVEVAVESLQIDRTQKLRKYAQTGIPEYWIIIPEEGLVEVYRKPDKGAYLEKHTWQKADSWMLEALDLPVKGSDLLI